MRIENFHKSVNSKTIVFTGILFFITNEVISTNFIGYLFSWVVFVGLLVVSFRNTRLAISALFVFTIMSSMGPRDIVDLRSVVGEESSFYTFGTTGLFGITISQVATIFVAIIVFSKSILSSKFSLPRNWIQTFGAVVIIFWLLLLATFINVLEGNSPSIRDIVSDARMVVLYSIGLILAVVASKYQRFVFVDLWSLITLIVLSTGFKTILVILWDAIIGNAPLSFGAIPYLALPYFWTVAYIEKKVGFKVISVLVLSLLAGIEPSRGNIAFFALNGFMYIILIVTRDLFHSNGYALAKIRRYIVLHVITLALPVIVLSWANERLYNFILYKAEFFTSVLSGADYGESTSVRVLEWDNILEDSSNSVWPIIIGRGLGSFFEFEYKKTNFELGSEDYSERELESRKFTRPHTFINFIYLKGGVIFLSLYVLSAFLFCWFGIRASNKANKVNSIVAVGCFVFFYFPFYFNMFWQPSFLLLNGYMFYTLINYEVKKNTFYL